jgi:hypothetical protein
MSSPLANTLPEPSASPVPSVRFRLRDVCVPPASELLAALWGDHVLEGQIVARSRTDGDADCVVVKVPGMDQMVVVSSADLLAAR